MVNPADFFALLVNQENVSIEVKVEDYTSGRQIWGIVPDSFTPDDLSSIAQFFENRAREMRGEHLS